MIFLCDIFVYLGELFLDFSLSNALHCIALLVARVTWPERPNDAKGEFKEARKAKSRPEGLPTRLLVENIAAAHCGETHHYILIFWTVYNAKLKHTNAKS